MVFIQDEPEVDTTQFLLEAAAPTRMPKPDERLFKVALKKTGISKPFDCIYFEHFVLTILL